MIEMIENYKRKFQIEWLIRSCIFLNHKTLVFLIL